MLPLLLAACIPANDDDPDGAEPPGPGIAGRLQNPVIDEVSGMARSGRHQDVFWVVNDDGPSVLHAINASGRDLGQVTVKKASNRDWEDLAAFTHDGAPYLLVADIGDNDSQRKDVRLYIVEEPEAGADDVAVAWRVEFTYPEGPRDAEAVAVDAAAREILVLTKRDVPARLYALPLRPDTDERIKARLLVDVDSLPQPSRQDIERAPATDNWHWQPTGMDLSPDGRRLVVLTYGGVYLYERPAGSGWTDALRQAPRVISATGNRQAESVAFDSSGSAIYITLEQRHAPLYRLELDGGPNE